MSLPKNDGSSVAPAPNIPPPTTPYGPSGDPAIAPSRAPAAIAPICGIWPAIARGIWDATSFAAPKTPPSSYACLVFARDGPSPAASPIACPRSSPACAAASGEPSNAPIPV